MTDAISPPGFDSRTAELYGRRVHYAVAGEGPAVVLVHGLGGAATNWAELAPLLADRRRVLVPDLPGHGGSEPLPALEGLASFAAAVEVCVRAEGLRRAAVVGHSLGGAVALRLALTRPARVSALVLAAGAGISSRTRRARLGLGVLGLLRPSRLAARYEPDVAARGRLRGLVFGKLASDPRALSRAAVAGFLAGSRRVTDGGSAAAALLADDPRPELDRIACPVLVLWGARDWFLPLEDAHEYSRRLRAPLRVLPDTGHLLIAERPRECAALIEEFLWTCGEGGGPARPAPPDA